MFNLINKVKEVNPLVLHYTNDVTINDCANITLAIGASPLMSFSYEEIDDIVSVSNAVVINIGTMNTEYIDLFIKAGQVANKYNKPVILDPVGVFATKKRAELTNKLLNEVKFDVVKGNMSEIKFIGGFDVKGKGVDSFDDGRDNTEVIKEIAKKLECVIVATGAIDVVTDGQEVYKINNGTSKLKGITGTGCMSASLIGSFLGITDNKLQAATMGTLCMSLSGELADVDNIAIGSFKVKLMDNIYSLDDILLKSYAKIEHTELEKEIQC